MPSSKGAAFVANVHLESLVLRDQPFNLLQDKAGLSAACPALGLIHHSRAVPRIIHESSYSDFLDLRGLGSKAFRIQVNTSKLILKFISFSLVYFSPLTS